VPAPAPVEPCVDRHVPLLQIPLPSRESGGSVLTEHITRLDGESVVFLPDAVFAITHAELKKSLLFFLEVDMGTETAASPRRVTRNDRRTKILLYRAYLANKGTSATSTVSCAVPRFQNAAAGKHVIQTEIRCAAWCRR